MGGEGRRWWVGEEGKAIWREDDLWLVGEERNQGSSEIGSRTQGGRLSRGCVEDNKEPF